MPTSRSRRPRAVAALTALPLTLALTLLGALAGATSPAGAGVEAPAPASMEAAAKQKTTITVLPPISQAGKKEDKAKKAKSVVTATFTPAQKNRTVTLFVKSGGFKKVATAKTTKDGYAEFSVPTKKGAVYKATAAGYRGNPAVSTKTAKNTWKGADFVDEFGGSTLSSNWAHRAPFYNPDGLRNCSKGDPSAVAVRGGALRLSVLADPARAAESCTALRGDGTAIGQFKYRLNGHISTAGNHDFRYGVAAARMKFQKERGQHASFWLQPSAHKPTATTAKVGGAEVDIIEWFGEGGKQSGLTSFIYHPSKKGPVKVGGFLTQQDRFLDSKKDSWFKAYHVFSVEWTPKYYIFRIDGRVSAKITVGISEVKQFPILSLLSSDYELEDLGSESKLPQHSYVDWMQIWER